MKRQVLKFIGKMAIAPGLMFLLLCGPVAVQASATETIHTGNSASSEMQISVVKADEHAILLHLQLENISLSNFTVYVTDGNGNELFSKEYKEKDLDVSVTLMRSENINSYKIGVRSKDKALNQDFSITPTVRYVQDVILTRQ